MLPAGTVVGLSFNMLASNGFNYLPDLGKEGRETPPILLFPDQAWSMTTAHYLACALDYCVCLVIIPVMVSGMFPFD